MTRAVFNSVNGFFATSCLLYNRELILLGIRGDYGASCAACCSEGSAALNMIR